MSQKTTTFYLHYRSSPICHPLFAAPLHAHALDATIYNMFNIYTTPRPLQASSSKVDGPETPDRASSSKAKTRTPRLPAERLHQRYTNRPEGKTNPASRNPSLDFFIKDAKRATPRRASTYFEDFLDTSAAARKCG